jgi:hypothetical protein
VLAGARRVAIFAGAAGSMSHAAAEQLERLLRRGLLGYDGVVISGGTAVGVPGAVGRSARELHRRLVGYTPAGRGDRALYPVIRETRDATGFSVREPLAMWGDILGGAFGLGDVRVVICPGGPITIGELLLARALGARVAWLDPTGEAAESLDEVIPLGADGVLELPPDPMTLRAFLTSSRLPDQLREPIARHFHNDYRRHQRGRKPPDDPALAPWEDLLLGLRISNLAQADDIPNKLALVGKRLVKDGAPLQLSDDQVELLAEVEHGRWNVERLSAGWELGVREVGRSASPDLKPWAELDEQTRNYDREAVRGICGALAAVGWGVADA